MEYIYCIECFFHKRTSETDISSRQKTPQKSSLLNLKIDMVNQFPIDLMHCVDLGVTKRILILGNMDMFPTNC